VARVTITPDSNIPPDPLFDVVPDRHTQRLPFDTQRSVPADALAHIRAAATPGVNVGSNSDDALLITLRELTVEAWVTEWENEPTREETVALTRIGKREVEEKPWGITLDGALVEHYRR
jgi:hypothetical protein